MAQTSTSYVTGCIRPINRAWNLIRVLVSVFCPMLGLVFIWTAIDKIQAPYDFLSTVHSYELLDKNDAYICALAIPWLELMIGVSLVVGVLRNGALLLSVLLLACFTYAKIKVLQHGLLISCGCVRDVFMPVNYSDVLLTALLCLLVFSMHAVSLMDDFSART